MKFTLTAILLTVWPFSATLNVHDSPGKQRHRGRATSSLVHSFLALAFQWFEQAMTGPHRKDTILAFVFYNYVVVRDIFLESTLGKCLLSDRSLVSPRM